MPICANPRKSGVARMPVVSTNQGFSKLIVNSC